MKLSQQTLAILKNFSQINANLMVRKGNQLKTMANATNIFASADIEETFDQDFGIYDLNEFLSAYSLLDDPDLTFDSSAVVLSSGKSKITYRFADESVLAFPTKNVNMPPVEFTLDITREILGSISKAASALGHAICSVTNEGKNIVLNVRDPKNPTANTFSTVVAEWTGSADFDLQIPIANLKVLPGDYTVSFCAKAISKWEHNSLPINYFIALEQTSTFNK
jgi:hypothetical protein